MVKQLENRFNLLHGITYVRFEHLELLELRGTSSAGKIILKANPLDAKPISTN